jgi:DNA-binding CsgD family transcriptional regulator
MARALSVLRSTHQHRSSAVVRVSGSSGIGKTALLLEVRQQATAMKFRVATAKCDPIEQVWPGAPVIALLRAGRDPLTTTAEFEQITRMISEPLVLADQIASQLENAVSTGPLLLAIDDLQWADRISRFLVRGLVARLAGLPVVWLLASREEDLSRDPTGYDRNRVEHIRLGPLSTPDLAAIAQDRLGRIPDERIRGFLEAAGGNPFLATQIIDSVARSATRGEADSVPAEFAAAVAHRVAALADAPRDVVHLVAVAGRPLPPADAAALMPGRGRADPGNAGDAAAVADAIESGLVIERDDALAFRHDLVREAVYAAMPVDLARRLHRGFADYYLAVADAPLIAASHARAAATPGDVASATILISASETLADINADDAGELAALAFRTIRPAQREWLELSLRCLRVLCRTQRPTDAIAVADLILARADGSDVTGEVETETAVALWQSGRVSEMSSRAERVLRLAAPDSRLAARMRAARALAGTRTLNGDVAARDAAVAVECARAANDREALALALRASGEAAKNLARHQSALAHFRELRSVTGAPWLAEEITQLQFLDRYDHAQALLDHARRDSRSSSEAVLPSLSYAQAWQDFTLGRLVDADAGARALVEIGQQLGNSMYTLDAIIIRVAVSLLRGEIHAAAAQLRRAGDLGADASVYGPGLAVATGWVAAAHGGLEQALNALRPVVEDASQSRSYWPLWPCWNGMFFEFATLAGDQEFAGTCIGIAEATAARNAGVASFEGVALNLRGRSRKDLDMIARSAAVLALSPRPILRGLGADTYGRALLADGQRPAGLAQLDRAWDEYHQMGAWAARADVQRAMHQAGVRRANWAVAEKPASGWPSLTEAERRVAELIGSGHTNKSAAAELAVSVNTIGTHLRAVFAKLGIQSRVQLANQLHQQKEATG